MPVGGVSYEWICTCTATFPLDPPLKHSNLLTMSCSTLEKYKWNVTHAAAAAVVVFVVVGIVAGSAAALHTEE